MEKEKIDFLGGEFYYDFQSRKNRLMPMEKYLSFLKGKEGLKILEIGSCEGQSTLWFLKKILSHPTSTITCVDPHDKRSDTWYNSANNPDRLKTKKITFELFKSNILQPYKDKVRYYQKKSWEALSNLKSKFDLIYIDGAHDFCTVYMDGKLSFPLLKEKGVIMFDDYWEVKDNQVFRAVNLLRRDQVIKREKVLNRKAVLILSRV